MANEYKLNTENIRHNIKSLSVMRGLTLAKLKELINKKYQKTDKTSNFSKKLITKNLRATELIEAADILGYDVLLRERR
jgi:hypothetical protein